MPARLPKVAALRILLDHAKDLPAIIASFDDLIKPESVTECWNDTKHTGDLLVPIIQEVVDTFRGDRFAAHLAVADMAAMEAEAAALGIDWQKLLDAIPKLLAIIEFVLDQFEIELE